MSKKSDPTPATQKTEKTKKTSPFDFYNSACYNKDNLIRDQDYQEGDYLPYIINRSFSYHADGIFMSNEMNIRPHVAKIMQYEYFLYGISKRKRFSKWIKNESDEDIDLVAVYYDVNKTLAKKYLSLLSKDQIDQIRNRMFKGGLKSK